MNTKIKNILISGLFGLMTTGLMANETGSFYNTNEQEIITYEIQDVTCFNQNNGSIEMTILNGENYWFSWDNGMNGQNIYNLSPGDYRVKIESIDGEIVYGTFTIESPDYIQGYITQENVGGGVNLDLIVEGGSLPYTYLWNGIETSEDLIGVTVEGINEVTITDANGCYLNLSTYVVNENIVSIVEENINESKINGVYDLSGNLVNLDYAPSGMYLIVNNGKITKIIK